jgi:hypothetical protein
VFESDYLLLPADLTASPFYITNLMNYIVGNTAVGGWSGFAFPILPDAIGVSRSAAFHPHTRTTLLFDGNTARSSGWWWDSAGAQRAGRVQQPAFALRERQRRTR